MQALKDSWETAKPSIKYRTLNRNKCYSAVTADLIDKTRARLQRTVVIAKQEILGETVNEDLIQEFVKNNLRAQVKSQGITGVNYIEFNFTPNANTYPPLPYDWKPAYPTIPSLPNQADQIIGGIQKLIDGMNQINIDGTQKKFDALLNNLNLVMGGNGKDNDGIIQSVKDLNVLLARIAKVTDKDELNVLSRVNKQLRDYLF